MRLRKLLGPLLLFLTLYKNSSLASDPSQSMDLTILRLSVDSKSLLHLAVLNKHESAAVAFVLSHDDQEEIQEFLPPLSDGIGVGQTFDLVLPFYNATPDVPLNLPQLDIQKYTLEAALFADGSSQGSKLALEHLNLIRQGRLYRLKRVMPILGRLKLTPDDDFRPALDKAITAVVGMDIRLDDGSNAKGLFANGIRSGGTTVLQSLMRIRDVSNESTTGARSQLLMVLATQEVVSSHLLTTAIKSSLDETKK